MNKNPQCAYCGRDIRDLEDDMISDLNELSQYHKSCWKKANKGIYWSCKPGEGLIFYNQDGSRQPTRGGKP